jgi:hypothetical protein
MEDLPMRRFLSLAALSLVMGACTFNVTSFSTEVTSTNDVPGVDHLALGAGGADGLAGTTLVIRGDERAEIEAVAHLVGLVGGDDDWSALVDRVAFDWVPLPADPGGVDLAFSFEGGLESAWIDRLDVFVPSAMPVSVAAGGASVSVSGVTADVAVHSESGSIHVCGAPTFDLGASSGSIAIVDGGEGTASAGSGSIQLDVAGPIVASASSGSITGTFGRGGHLSASSGSLAVELVGALDRDLTLEAGGGSIILTVPAGAAMDLDLDSGSGSVVVDAGSVDSGGESFRGSIGGGGFLVFARAGSGSIIVEER